MPSSDDLPQIQPLEPLLSTYKSLSKLIIQRGVDHSQVKVDIGKVLRDVERWIAEAKIGFTNPLEWVNGDEDPEVVALENLCETLVQTGMLVPLSRK